MYPLFAVVVIVKLEMRKELNFSPGSYTKDSKWVGLGWWMGM